MSGKRFITACVAALCVLLAGCGPAHRVSMEEASLRDVVMVVQVGNQVDTQSFFPQKAGFLLLVHADGTYRTVDVGLMATARPLWSDAGVYFGGPKNEYLLSADALTTIARSEEERHEISRFLTPDGKGFISFYNSGGDPHGYMQRIVAGDAQGVETLDVPGIYTTVGQCGDRIFALTDTGIAPQLSAEAERMAKELPDIGSEVPESDKEEGYDVLVQVYPREGDLHPKIVGVSKRDANMSAGAVDFPCIDNTLYIPAHKRGNSDAPKQEQDPRWGSVYMQVWDISTGQRTYMPLHNEQGQSIELNDNYAGPYEGEQKGNTYTFFARNGQVFTTDLTTGVTHEKVQIPIYENSFWSEYRVRDGCVYALGPSGEGTDASFALKRYNVETGESKEILTIPEFHKLLTEDMWVFGMAFNPEWLNKVK
ncbi:MULTISPECIES: hypothetical protein [unclassified Schaalia]|uniref:hypothetical protein n=1 Tax=unclassified Schaalia TaxID=2691889 RepID=UPI001E60907A|nr:MULTISPECIES: hypothetical protein [unclassified Schaalia]MCD4549081.1 hypothetical protein [Schaalia sp. lx-260]MCD4557269.1 hypothetical protein [Schaalia sp. lx-100]